MEGWQRAFVLHSRPYSETSLLLDLFSESEGRVRVLAKGARSCRSQLKGALQPFTPLLVRWGGRGEELLDANRRVRFPVTEQFTDPGDVITRCTDCAWVAKFAPSTDPVIRQIKRVPATTTCVAVQLAVLEEVKEFGAELYAD